MRPEELARKRVALAQTYLDNGMVAKARTILESVRKDFSDTGAAKIAEKGSSPKELPQISGRMRCKWLFHRTFGLPQSRVHLGHGPEDVPRRREGAQASACQFASRRAALGATALAFGFAGRRKQSLMQQMACRTQAMKRQALLVA